jgi:hypothetical protein
VKERRTFHARWNAERQWWDLYCRKCDTTEEVWEEVPPQKIAELHHLWFHVRPVTIPVGWANPR